MRATSSLAWTSLTGGGRVRGNVPESLVNRLRSLATETGTAAPVAPSSDVRERFGTAPPPRTQLSENRLGRLVDENQTRSQTLSRTGDPATTATPAVTANQSTSAMPVEGVRVALEPSRPQRLGTVQGGHVSEVEHEHVDVSGGRKEDDRRRVSHGVTIISNTGRGLAVSLTGAV